MQGTITKFKEELPKIIIEILSVLTKFKEDLPKKKKIIEILSYQDVTDN